MCRLLIHRHEAESDDRLGDGCKAKLLVVGVARVRHEDREGHFLRLLHCASFVFELEHTGLIQIQVFFLRLIRQRQALNERARRLHSGV